MGLAKGLAQVEKKIGLSGIWPKQVTPGQRFLKLTKGLSWEQVLVEGKVGFERAWDNRHRS